MTVASPAPATRGAGRGGGRASRMAERVSYNQLHVSFAFEGKNKSFMRGQIHLVGSHIQIICIGNVNHRYLDGWMDR